MAEPWGYAVAHLDEDGKLLDWFSPISGEYQELLTYEDAVYRRGTLDAEWWRIVEIRPVDESDV